MLPLTNAEIKRLSPAIVSRVAFGVRYAPKFALGDNLGSLIDAILRTEGTPFGPELFPLNQSDANSCILTDLDGSSTLRISHQDTILQLSLDTRDLDRIQGLGDDFDRYVLRPMHEINKLAGITRYGALFSMDELKGLQKRPVNYYLSSDFPEADTLAMRFTRRLHSDEALVKKRVDDYRNVIYTLKEDEHGIAASIDYQEYFKPELSSNEWAEKPFSKFASRSIGYFEGEYQRWFSRLIDIAEVA